MKSNKSLTEKQAMSQVSDPILSKYHPHRFFGSISEKMESSVVDYIKNDALAVSLDKQGKKALKYKFPVAEPEEFKKMYYHKYLKSLVNPGENVGTIAAQSIGEPST